MLASNKTKRGVIGAIVLAGVLAVGGYALTNTIAFGADDTAAGFGGADVQVQTVTDVDYTLDGTDKTQVDALVFTVGTAIETVGDDAVAYAQINDTAAWITCDAFAEGATTITCQIPTPSAGNIVDIGGDAANAEDGSGTNTADGKVKLVVVE